MKNKFAIASAFFAATSFSMGEIVVNDVLSYEGFVDMSYTYLDEDGETDNNFGVEEVEISWLFDFDPITARLDIEYEENGNALEVERAYVVYDLGEKCENSSITVGRYASMLGFEAYEPTGLYQYSNAYGYSLSGFAAAGSQADIYNDSELSVYLNSIFFPVGERYSQGIRYTYEDEKSFFAFALQDGTINYENRLGGDGSGDSTAVDDGGYGFEAAYAYDLGNGLNVFVGGSYEIGDGVNLSAPSGLIFDTGNTETYIFNSYATYEFGAWLFAFEINFSETFIDSISNSGTGPILSGDAEVDSLTSLFMANYAYSERASITGRLSFMETEYDAASNSEVDGNAMKYTIAHNYAFLDNLVFRNEFSYLNSNFDVDGNGSVSDIDGNLEELFFAAEMIFTF
jgi:hypothetical protein